MSAASEIWIIVHLISTGAYSSYIFTISFLDLRKLYSLIVILKIATIFWLIISVFGRFVLFLNGR